MAEMIQCTSCHKKFRLPASAVPGHKFRCPGCKTVLTVPKPEEDSVVPETVEDEKPQVVEIREQPVSRPQAEPPPFEPGSPPTEKSEEETTEGDADTWQLVGRGAKMHVIAHGAFLAALLLSLIAIFTISSSSDTASSRGPKGSAGIVVKDTLQEILEFLSMVALLGGLVVALIAVGLWLVVPSRHGTRGLAIALLTLTALVLLRYSSAQAGSREAGLSSPTLFLLMEGARLTVLALFIQSVGRNLRQPSLIKEGGLLMIVTPAALGGMLVICYIIAKAADPGETLFKVLISLIVLTLAGVIGYSLMILINLARAVRRKGGRTS